MGKVNQSESKWGKVATWRYTVCVLQTLWTILNSTPTIFIHFLVSRFVQTGASLELNGYHFFLQQKGNFGMPHSWTNRWHCKSGNAWSSCAQETKLHRVGSTIFMGKDELRSMLQCERMILPYLDPLWDTRVERTLLNMNASETSTDFQILRVPFLIVITVTAVTVVQTYTLEKAAEAERDARCLDLAMELKWSHPGSLGMEYDPRLRFFFWHSLKHLKQFQNVLENWLTMLTTLTCTPEAYLPLVPDSADQDMGTKILTVLDDLRWGAGNSQCFHFFSLSAALHFVAPGFGKRWRRHVL